MTKRTENSRCANCEVTNPGSPTCKQMEKRSDKNYSTNSCDVCGKPLPAPFNYCEKCWPDGGAEE